MPVLIFMAFMAVVSGYNLMMLPQLTAEARTSVADKKAANLLVYKSALVVHLQHNPIDNGVVPEGRYALPAGWTSASSWRHVVQDRTLYIYEAQPSQTPELIKVLLEKTAQSVTLGINKQCRYQSAVDNAIAGALPAALCSGINAIPEGAVVMVGA
jgi:hypothetical protein